MTEEYTIKVQYDGEWWIGWVEGYPGVNCQEASLGALLDSIASAIDEFGELE